MKKVVLLALFGTAMIVANAQENYNKWSIGLHVGGHDGMAPSNARTRLFQIHHYDLNVRYMFNNRVGLMLDGGYDFLDFYDAGYNTNYVRTSLQGVVNAGDMLRFNSFSKRLGLLLHGGAGVSTMWQKDLFPEGANDGFLGNNDNMINFIFGATPQIKINERFALNADVSFIFHSRQTRNFDMRSLNTNSAIDGYMLNLSIGANIYLGKHERHADWVATQDVKPDNSLLEGRLSELESKLADADKDGVPDYRDAESDTPEGSYVNSKGEALAEEKVEETPQQMNDQDNDGVADTADDCPDQAGTAANRGCPEVAKEDVAIMSQAVEDVKFKTGSDVLTDGSKGVLDEVANALKNNPSYKLRIEGHTDNVGSDEDNMTLSQKRADAVKKYLTDKGVEGDRIMAEGLGESQPLTTNETPEGRAKNRRVNFLIVHKL